MKYEKSPTVRVLIVEDELLIRWSLSQVLAASGVAVVEAADARTALQTLADGSPFDVVVLDYRLPDSNDLGLLATVRRVLPSARVIVMTAFGTPELTQGALALGAHTVVNKPFELSDMAALVRGA